MSDLKAFDVSRFCNSHLVSRAALYKLWKLGLGPQTYKVGTRVYISQEAAKE